MSGGWVANPRPGATWTAHRVGEGGKSLCCWRQSVAGWQPVETFAAPWAFTRCYFCERAAAASEGGDER